MTVSCMAVAKGTSNDTFDDIHHISHHALTYYLRKNNKIQFDCHITKSNMKGSWHDALQQALLMALLTTFSVYA